MDSGVKNRALMSLYGYKPKTRKAPWVKVLAVNRDVRKFVRSVSKSRVSRQKLYREKSRAFLRALRREGKLCPVVTTLSVAQLRAETGCTHRVISKKITETHHMRGRAGTLYLDERFWLGVSKIGHRWIHMNMDKARARGWLCAKGLWGVSARAEEVRKALAKTFR